MMNLVIDRVLNHPRALSLPLTERCVLFLKPMRRDGLPYPIQLRRRIIPATENFGPRLRFVRFRPVDPLSGGDTGRHRNGHPEHFARELSERPHATDRELE